MLKFIGEKCGEENNNGFYCPFVYLHGNLEAINKYDLVRLEKNLYNDIPLNTEVDCSVKIDGKDYLAKGFFWTNGMHTLGLICDINDTEYIEDAREKQSLKKYFI